MRPPSKFSVTVHAVVVALRWRRVTTVVSSLTQVDRLRVLPLQFGIEAAGIGNVGDQPVEPLHVVLDHREQARRGCSSVLASGSVSTAERSEVSGFFSSCATSAAKLSIASMRL